MIICFVCVTCMFQVLYVSAASVVLDSVYLILVCVVFSSLNMLGTHTADAFPSKFADNRFEDNVEATPI